MRLAIDDGHRSADSGRRDPRTIMRDRQRNDRCRISLNLVGRLVARAQKADFSVGAAGCDLAVGGDDNGIEGRRERDDIRCAIR